MPNEILDRNKWRASVLDLIEETEEELAHSPEALDFLYQERGLNDSTIRQHRLGLVREYQRLWRSDFGLKPSYLRQDGKEVWKVAVSEGITIPHRLRPEGVISLTVRCWDAAYGRYRSLPGSRLEAMCIAGSGTEFEGVVAVVESPLCAMKLNQDTGVTVIALGGVHTTLGEEVVSTLESAEKIILIMDDDAAGFEAAESYQIAFPQAVSCPVPRGKDVTEAWQAGLDLKQYMRAAVSRADRVLSARRSDHKVTMEPIQSVMASQDDSAEDTASLIPAPVFVSSEPDTATLAAPVVTPAQLSGARGYRYITDPSEAKTAVLEMVQGNDLLAIDIETAPHPDYPDHAKAGLSPTLSRIRLVQLAGRCGDALLIDAFACSGELTDILDPLCTHKLVAHNAVFEMAHLTHVGMAVGIMECTMLMWNALKNETIRERSPGDPKSMALSLKSVLWRALSVEVSKALQKSDWSRPVLEPEQLQYAADDVLHLVRLHDVLLNRLRMDRSEAVYQRMRNCQPTIVSLQQGFPFDGEVHKQMIEEWRAEAGPLEKQVRSVMGDDINLNSKHQLDAFFRANVPAESIAAWPTTSKGLLSTTEETLEANADLDVVAPLLRLRKLEKRISTYGEKMAAFVDPVTGRLMANFHLTGAVTGRMSSSQPGFQNMPRGDFRKIFTGGTGMVIAADFSQIELRVAAEMSKDRAMRQAFRDGVDIHQSTASRILGVDMAKVDEQSRQMAKVISFGTLYGQSGEGLRTYARDFGVEMTAVEARQFQKRFFAAYPQLRSWREDIRKGARRKESVHTKGGRVRTFKGKETSIFPKSLNTPVQGTAGEIQLRALTLVEQELSRFEDARIVNAVHDEIVVIAREEDADAVARLLQECMTRAFLEMFPDAPTMGLVECGVGENWAEAK
ncbi:MAG: hypothetical protein GX130_05330 [Candidatus Hydrogenedens sp.]|nr:hypothetical protein [Candidatus Hydrogenedens sp.]